MDLGGEVGEREACYRLVTRAQLSTPPRPVLMRQPCRQQRRYQARELARRAAARATRASSVIAGASAQAERQAVLDAAHEARFIDRSVPYIHATLLDEGSYHCSMSTMYRILHSVGEVGERRDQATRPAHVKPELCATASAPSFRLGYHQAARSAEVDLLLPLRRHRHLQPVHRGLDGCRPREFRAGAHAARRDDLPNRAWIRSKLTMHADRGSSMTSKPVAFMLADLGVTKSHSRPHVCDDNPHIESFFKTAKYQPEFPATFANIVEARAFCRVFLTGTTRASTQRSCAPDAGRRSPRARAGDLQQRQVMLDAAYDAHPERFVHGSPKVRQLPTHRTSIDRRRRLTVLRSEASQMQAHDRE